VYFVNFKSSCKPFYLHDYLQLLSLSSRVESPKITHDGPSRVILSSSTLLVLLQRTQSNSMRGEILGCRDLGLSLGSPQKPRSRSIPTEHFFLYCVQLEPEAKQRVDDRDSRFSGDWTVVELAAGELIRRTDGHRDTSVDRRVRRCGRRLLLHAAS